MTFMLRVIRIFIFTGKFQKQIIRRFQVQHNLNSKPKYLGEETSINSMQPHITNRSLGLSNTV